jgi:hypothetical protein
VLPLHPSMVLPPSTSRSPWLTAFWIRITPVWADPPKSHRGPRLYA